MKRINKLLVDASSVLMACLHAAKGQENSFLDPEPEEGKDPEVIPSALDGYEIFLGSLEKTMDEFGFVPSQVILVKDGKGSRGLRQAVFPPYKKHRSSSMSFLNEFNSLQARAEEMLWSYGALSVVKDGYEADDLLAAIWKKGDWIWSRDGDLIAAGDWFYGGERNPDKFLGITKERIVVYKSLVGDTSDGFKGCPSFGPKAFENMIIKYGDDVCDDILEMLKNETLHELGEYAEEFKPFAKVVELKEKVYQSYYCAKFHHPGWALNWQSRFPSTNGDLPKWNTSDTLVTTQNYAAVLSDVEHSTFSYSVIDYETDTCQESKDWCETSGVSVDVIGSEITGMGLRINYSNYYFCVNHADTDNITEAQLLAVLTAIEGKPIYAHNSTGFENVITHNTFGDFLDGVIDTQLMASYVNENDMLGLKHLSKRDLKYSQASYEDTTTKTEILLDENGEGEYVYTQLGMSELTGNEVVKYGIDDVVVTDILQRRFTCIMEYEGTLDAFHNVEDDASYFTSLCFINGVDFDKEAYTKLKADNDKHTDEAWKVLNTALLEVGWEGGKFIPVRRKNAGVFNKIHEALYGKPSEYSSVQGAKKGMPNDAIVQAFDGTLDDVNALYEKYWKPKAEFNVRSPKQMCRLLYEILGMKIRIRNKPTNNMRAQGKEGNPASSETAIQNSLTYQDTDKPEVLKLLLEYKGYLTKESLFFSKWPNYVHWKTGKIHCSMKQSSTSTRRFSHSKPNMAQLPKRKGKEVRDMMVSPEEDWYIWALDIDSQELILQAWASKDPSFLACYQGDVKKDIHSLTGFQVAKKQGVDFESYENFMTQKDGEAKPYRVLGKATNFATAYLCGAPKLSQMLCVVEKEAQAFMDAKAVAFPGLMPAVEEYIKICKARGYAETFEGARRHLGGHQHFGSSKKYEISAAGRLAWSFRIQSSAASQIKLSTGRMYREGLFDDSLCMPVTIIHDEAVGIIHKSVLEERMPKLIACICQKYEDMEIKTSTTPEIGRNFGSLTEWKG